VTVVALKPWLVMWRKRARSRRGPSASDGPSHKRGFGVRSTRPP